jgi:hypothetical protein
MARSFVWAVLGGVFCLSLSAAGCSDGNVDRARPRLAGRTAWAPIPEGAAPVPCRVVAAARFEGGAASVPSGQGVGEACGDAEPCRDGLTCNRKDVCEPAGDKAPGDACVLGAECAEGQCVGRQCAPAGEGLADADCRRTATAPPAYAARSSA